MAKTGEAEHRNLSDPTIGVESNKVPPFPGFSVLGFRAVGLYSLRVFKFKGFRVLRLDRF